MSRRECALMKEGHPQKILIIAQTAAAALQVWLLDVNAVSGFGMAGCLVLHSELNVFAFVTDHAGLAESRPEKRREFAIAHQWPRLQHRGLREHVGIRKLDCLSDGAGGMADFESHIPEEVKHLLDDLRSVRRDGAIKLVVQEHD